MKKIKLSFLAVAAIAATVATFAFTPGHKGNNKALVTYSNYFRFTGTTTAEQSDPANYVEVPDASTPPECTSSGLNCIINADKSSSGAPILTAYDVVSTKRLP